MNSFEEALKNTLRHEGGYAADPDDAGGETYKGISRRFHPAWPGWEIIDQAKGMTGFPFNLDRQDLTGPLRGAVSAFYRQNFWDRFCGDAMPPRLAKEMFDTSVNLGVHRAVRFLQEGLNLLNRNQQSYPDIVEDGAFGSGTARALAAYVQDNPPEYLLTVLNVLQGNHYINYMRKSPVQEKFARGWLSRVSL